MKFEDEKQKILSRFDKSNKGSIDKDILPLVKFLNSHPDFVTTSSCSGRAVLLKTNEEFSKLKTEWIYVTHSEIDENLFVKLRGDEKDIWFKFEGAILHVKCRNNLAAELFLNHAKHCGFKRTGIISLKNFPVIELTSSEQILVPLVKDWRIIVTERFIQTLSKISNHFLKKNHKKVTTLLQSLKKVK